MIMMKFFLVPVCLLAVMAGCKKNLQDLSVNNNKPVSVPAALLLTGVLNDLYDAPNQQTEIINQYYLYNYDYYGNNRYDFGSGSNYYRTLENVARMDIEAVKSGSSQVNPYNALGKFFRSYFFAKMSLQQGDIPFTQALQGISNLTPLYDPQKNVFINCLALLDSANTELAVLINKGDNNLAGDIYYGSNLKKWQKAVNTFKLRLLIELSKKDADPDVNVKNQFSAIISNKNQFPVFESEADNLQYTYLTPTNFYPNNPGTFGYDASRKNMSSTYLGLLTQFSDPRTFVVAEPARNIVDVQGKSPLSFSSFVGADPGLDLGVMYSEAGAGKYSFLNRKYFFSTYTGEKSIQIGYAELQFNIAEAINRGWISGDAESYYMRGIKSSIQSYGIPLTGTFTAYFYRPGSTDVANAANYDAYPVNVDWNTYYVQPVVKYSGNNATGLKQILQQKYLALFRHSGLEAYYNYRRTGVPDFSKGPGSGNGSRIALRFQYPGSERSFNTTNYNSALQNQYSGQDDINGIMWLLK